MATYRIPLARIHQINSSGSPLSGCKLYVYQTGTTTSVSLFSDRNGSSGTANPIVADDTGRLATTYTTYSGLLTLVLKDSGGSTIWSDDNIQADPSLATSVLSAITASTIAALQVAFGLRETLTAPRNYYVRTDGSDSNTGLANNAGSAFLTIQKAIDVVLNTIDNAGYDIAINVAAGTYTGSVVVNGPWVGDGTVYLVLPASVIISTTSATAILVERGGRLYVNCDGGGKIQTTTSGDGFSAILGGALEVNKANFGAVAGSKWTAGTGGQIVSYGNVTSTGNAVSEMHADAASILFGTGSYTLSGTPAYSSYFIGTSNNGMVSVTALTFSGSATGQRFVCHKNSTIEATGLARTGIPGSTAGQTANGGRFIGTDGKEFFHVDKNGTDQTGVASSTATQVTFGTERYDTNAIFASNAATVTAGVWEFHAQVKVSGASANAALKIMIYKDGAEFKSNTVLCDGSGVGSGDVSCRDYASGSNVYTVYISVASGGTSTVVGTAALTYFEGIGH